MPAVAVVILVIAAILVAEAVVSFVLAHLAVIAALVVATAAGMVIVVTRAARRHRMAGPPWQPRELTGRQLPEPVNSGGAAGEPSPFEVVAPPPVVISQAVPDSDVAAPGETCEWKNCRRSLDGGDWQLSVHEADDPESGATLHLFCSKLCLEFWQNADQRRRAGLS